jgi:hypothetical protein
MLHQGFCQKVQYEARITGFKAESISVTNEPMRFERKAKEWLAMLQTSNKGLWVQVTAQGAGSDSWLWRPGIQASVDAVDAHQLLAEGWQQVGPDSNLTQSICLWGQLREIYLLQTAEEEKLELWARETDLAQVAAVPVALAFSLPENVRQTISPLLLASNPPEALLMAINLPPPQLGEIALIATSQGWQQSSIGQLEANAQQLQHRIGEALTALAAPADWWLWDDLLATCCQPGGYEVKRQELRSALRTTRGRADEQVHQQLAALEIARVQAESLQATYARTLQDETSWLNQYQQIQTMARQLAELYWNSYQRSQHPTRMLPHINNIFLTAQAEIPATLTVQAVLAAYSNAASGATQWTQSKPESPPFFHYSKEAGTTVVELRPNDSEVAPTESTIRSLWDQIRQFTDLDGDVFLAALAQSMAISADDEGYIWLTGAQILDYRGIRPIMKQEGAVTRRAGHRQEDLASVAACFSRMRNTWVTLRQMVEENRVSGRGRRKKRLYTHESQLIQVGEVIRQHELSPGEPSSAAGASFAVAWRYRPGTWLKPFLDVPNRQMAWLCQQVLRYDPFREQWEKRLARYFIFHLRLSAAGGSRMMTCVIGKLLHELSLPIDQRNPQRVKERFEQAMDQLQKDQQIDSWKYEESNPQLPPRRWLETWLTWTVRVTTNPLASLNYQKPEEPSSIHRTRSQVLLALQEGQKEEEKEE